LCAGIGSKYIALEMGNGKHGKQLLQRLVAGTVREMGRRCGGARWRRSRESRLPRRGQGGHAETLGELGLPL